MDEDAVERPRDIVGVERVDEEAGVADLATPAAAKEPAKLLLGGALASGARYLRRRSNA